MCRGFVGVLLSAVGLSMFTTTKNFIIGMVLIITLNTMLSTLDKEQ